MLTVADVLDPRGPILPSWFDGEGDGAPGTALHERIAHYLAEAQGDDERDPHPMLRYAEDQDLAVTRWVEYRAYSVLARKSAAMSGLQSATFNDQGSFTLRANADPGASYRAEAANALQAWRLLTSPPEIVRSADGRFSRFAWALPEEEEET